MMKTWIKAVGLGSAVALAAAACDDDGTGTRVMDDQAVLAEAALVAADGMYQDLSLAQDPGLQEFGFLGMGSGPAPGQGMGGHCSRMGTGGTFGCGNLVRDGFTFTREVTFYDEDGEVQPEGFDPATTDAVHLVVSAEGTRDRAFWTASMERSREMRLTELLSDAHHLNGEGYGEVHRSGNPQGGGEMTFDMTVEVTWDEVVHLQPREEHPYPESGTITRDIWVEVTRDGEVVGGRDVTVVITFDGSRYATMTVDGESHQIDLAQREVKGRWGRRGGAGG